MMKQSEDSRPPGSEVTFHLSFRALVAFLFFIAAMTGILAPDSVAAILGRFFG